VRDCILENVK